MSGSAPGWGRKGEQVTLDLCEHLHIHCLTSSTEGACAEVLLALFDRLGESQRRESIWPRAVNGGLRQDPAPAPFEVRSFPIVSSFAWCSTERGREQGKLEGLIKEGETDP